MRKLASIQTIKSLEPIPNADKIELARVLGWKCVVKKGEFKVGDKCVYIEIDSIPPSDNPVFDFLKHSNGRMGRIKTIKLRGQISQGLAMPVTMFSSLNSCHVGDDVTEKLGIKKWEPDKRNTVKLDNNPLYIRRFHNDYLKWLYREPWKKLFRKWIYVRTRCKFPLFINKTDETRVQVLGGMLTKYKGAVCYVTEKIDGQSITIWWDNDCKIHVASRNYEIIDHDDYMWKVVEKEEVDAKAKMYFTNIPNLFIQGELIGPGIQGNKYKLNDYRIYFFNVGSHNNGKVEYYDNYTEFNGITKAGLRHVPVLDKGYKLDDDIDAIVDMAKGKSQLNYNVNREGIVIRPCGPIYDSEIAGMVGNRISFKAINPDFLLKYDA